MGLGYQSGYVDKENETVSFSISGNHAGGSLGYTSFFGYQTPNPIWSSEETH